MHQANNGTNCSRCSGSGRCRAAGPICKCRHLAEAIMQTSGRDRCDSFETLKVPSQEPGASLMLPVGSQRHPRGWAQSSRLHSAARLSPHRACLEVLVCVMTCFKIARKITELSDLRSVAVGANMSCDESHPASRELPAGPAALTPRGIASWDVTAVTYQERLDNSAGREVLSCRLVATSFDSRYATKSRWLDRCPGSSTPGRGGGLAAGPAMWGRCRPAPSPPSQLKDFQATAATTVTPKRYRACSVRAA